jgi:NADH dehydrogenase FAD-containing subunit
VQVLDLADLCRDVGARFRRGTVEAVAARAHRVRLASGGTADYDALVVAVGARATAGVPGALTFRDQRDSDRVRDVVEGVVSGAVRRLAFVAPTGVAWTLPLYELALLTAAEAAGTGSAEITIVTPERRALEVFGRPVSDAIEALLADRDIRLLVGSYARQATRRNLELHDGWSVEADRVVAIPRLVGRGLSGIPQDWSGFVATDAWGRVPARPDVFAAGTSRRSRSSRAASPPNRPTRSPTCWPNVPARRSAAPRRRRTCCARGSSGWTRRSTSERSSTGTAVRSPRTAACPR